MKPVPTSRYVTFLLVTAFGCAADLVTKSWIFAKLGMPGQRPSIWLWQEVFGFTTSLNEGALFGVGQGQVVLFACLSVVAAVGILYWLFVAGAARELLLTFALAAVMAGILGNLYDRLGLPGLNWPEYLSPHRAGEPVYAVRDWLDFRLIHWPIFNIADSLLVCGAALLVWHACRAESQGQGVSTAAPASSPMPAAGAKP